MSNIRPLVFPTYDEAVVGENDCVLKAALTSANDLGGGALIGTTPSGASYSSAGINFGGLAGLQYDLADFIGLAAFADLMQGGTVYFEISKHFFDDAYTDSSVRYLFRMDVNIRLYMLSGASDKLRLDVDANAESARRSEGLPDMVPCWIVFVEGSVKFYVNYLLRNNGVADQRSVQTVFYLPSLGTVGSPAPDLDSFRNFAVWNREMIIPPHRYSFGWIGDSFVNFGAYSSSIAAITNEAANGPVETGFTDSSAGGATTGMLPACHAQLAKHGINISGERIQNWGVAALTVTAPGSNSVNWTILADRVADMSAYNAAGTGNVTVADVTMITIGTNEASSGSPSHPSTDFTDGTFKNALQTDIDNMKLAGAKFIVINTIIGRLDADATQLTDRPERIDNANIAINELTNVDLVVDQFTYFGGHNIAVVDLAVDGIHPSETGQSKYGQYEGDMMVSSGILA